MADSPDGDVLMYMAKDSESGQAAVPAEASSEVDRTKDTLANDFYAGKFFEVEGFTFGMKLLDSEDDAASVTPQTGRSLDQAAKTHVRADQRRFGRWRTMTTPAASNKPLFKSLPEDVSVVRLIDMASPVLTGYCLTGETFKRVALVKRARLASSGLLAGVLRLEFKDASLRAIEWADGEGVRETLKFQFKKVTVTYVPRKEDGSPAAPWPAVNWEWKES